ncbi:DEAH-box RNA helicase prp16 [Monosporozyma unispora]|nr:DEAH-box RNA helicase prp16 [Kazachstania unispora]
MSDDIQQFLKSHTTSSVTPNLVKIVQKLAQTKPNVSDFTKAVKVILKFKEHDPKAFISELYEKLNGKGRSLSVNPKISKGNNDNTSLDIPLKKKKKLVALSFDDEDEDEDIQIKPVFKKRQTEQKITFKKLDKSTASKLKEYAEVKYGNWNPSTNNPNVKKIPSGSANTINKVQEPSLSNFESEDELPTNLNDNHFGKDDEEWYNYDDDLGNAAQDEIDAVNSLNFVAKTSKPQLIKPEQSDVQLYPLSIDKKKNWLPPFLLNYSQKYNISNAAIVGSIAESSHEGIIDPIKNPESTFSQMARKGSHLVNLKRLNKEQRKQNKTNTQLANTAMGNTLGFSNESTNDKSGEQSTDNIFHNELQPSQEDIQKQRQTLPAYKARGSLIPMIMNNQVAIIIGETGSGKTTQLPQILYEAGFCHDNTSIGITQPRRVAAMSVAKRVATEMNTPLGQKVGYSIRFEDQTSAETRIKFMTDGILLRETLLDPLLLKYNCIIIDEAHERSLNTDVLLGIFKNLLTKRKDIKLIITSATMNAAKFSKFFGNAPQFTIPGRTFPVQIIYTKSPVDDYVDSAVNEAVRIHMQTEVTSGDILIFMTGQEDIETTCESIKDRLTEVYAKKNGVGSFDEIDDIEIFPIYSALPPELQARIFHKLDHSKRKIVVATNIAETSLTIDGIKYVIDSGYSKLKVFNPRIGLDSLMITPISLANANQRSGRAGRTGPGIAYRLFTQESAEEDMYVQTIPEIQRTNLSNTILLLKSLDINDIVHFPFLDKPPLQTLLASLYELWFLGAIDNFGNLTSLGSQMSKFPLQASLSKVLIVASQNKCSEELLTIVSMLSVPQVFNRPKEREKEADQARGRFFVPRSDHLTLLNVYNQWKSNKFSSQWCEKNFLIYRSLARAHEIRRQLVKVMRENDIPLVSSGSDWNIVRRSICSGFAHQAAKVTGLRKYVNLRTGMAVELHPTSALYGLGDPPTSVVYHELLMTSKEYMCFVTAVDPFWLMEFGPLIYDIKRVKQYEDDCSTSLFGTSDDHEEDKVNHDFVDVKIEQFIAKRQTIINQLKADVASSSNLITQKERQNTHSQGNIATIGFKRRRPL